MVINIINIIAIIVIPIVSVIIGQYLQNRSEKRKDKMRVFTHLMSYRYFGYTDQVSVNVLNSVPFVFNDNEDVIEKYNIYIKSLNCRPEEIEIKSKEINDNKTKMLEEMAKALKYKNINWEIIQNPYLPEGLINQIHQENIFRQGQVEIAKALTQRTNSSEEKISILKKIGEEIENKIKKQKSNKR